MGGEDGRSGGRRGKVYAAPPPRTIAREILGAPGRGLPANVRGDMESRFQRPLDRVRIHEGDDADRWTRAGNATALTVGRHIAFSRGSFAPGTAAGRALIAHELAHAVQQGTPSPSEWRWGGHATASEHDAHAAASSVMSGQPHARVSSSSSGEIQRQPAPKLPDPEPNEPWWETPAANDNVPAETTGEAATEEGLGEEAVGVGGAAVAAVAAGLFAFFWDEDEAAPEWPNGRPNEQPRPNPRAKPEEPENKRGCFAEWVAPKGNNACHDMCAQSISGVPLEYQVTTPEGLSVSFDAVDLTTTLYEVKTGYRWMLNPSPDAELAERQAKVREQWLVQSEQQLLVAERCGYPLVWTFNEPDVADYASGLIEPMTEAIDCPCPKPKRPKRKATKAPSKHKKPAPQHKKAASKRSKPPRRKHDP